MPRRQKSRVAGGVVRDPVWFAKERGTELTRTLHRKFKKDLDHGKNRKPGVDFTVEEFGPEETHDEAGE